MSATQRGEQPSMNAGIHDEPTADCNDSLKGETRARSIHGLITAASNVDPRRKEATTRALVDVCGSPYRWFSLPIVKSRPIRPPFDAPFRRHAKRQADAVGGIPRPPVARRQQSAPARWHLGRYWKRSSFGGNIRSCLPIAGATPTKRIAEAQPLVISHLLSPFCYHPTIGQGPDGRRLLRSPCDRT